ncbi:MAG: hypothetical protein ACKVP5_21320 [Aestuariivirga sp.]
MPAPPRSFLTVTDTAIRWQVPALDIAGWAIDGEIALSAVLPTVDTADKQVASGIVEIDGADVVALFRRDSASRKPALVRRFRRSKKADWEWIARPVDGVAVTAADVIILRAEFERCERAWGLFDVGAADSGTKASSPAKRPAGPGAPPKHDWDAVAGAIARRVHDHGMPVSQGELVRDMMDWFAGREDFLAPDERTVRRKVSAIWRELRSD